MAGLFDTYKSPDEVKRGIRQENIALDRSAPTGWQAISSAAYGGGRGLAQGLGGEDPRIGKAQKLQQIQQELVAEGWEEKAGTPEFFAEIARRVAPVDPQMAMQAAMQGKELERKMSKEDVSGRYMEAQIKNLEAPKTTLTPKQKDYEYLVGIGKSKEEAYRTIYGKEGGNKVTIEMPGHRPYELEKGYMLKDENDPSKGVTPIPGGSKDKMSGESVGKAQMLRTAKKQIGDIKSLIYTKKGKVDWENIATGKVPLVGGSVPWTKGRDLATKMEFGIQGITRIETGAAMPQEEVENTRRRFQPRIGDTDETVKVKIEMFEDFITGGLTLLDPSGKFDDERFQSEYQKRTVEKGIHTSSGGVSFKVLP